MISGYCTKCVMEEIVGQVKWTISNHTKVWSSSKKVMLCIWWDWKGVLYYEHLLENQRINSNKYCSQLHLLKAALKKKHPRLVNRKYIIFHQDTTSLHASLMTRQNLTIWLGSSDSSTVFTTLYLWISIYFSLCKILLMEKISVLGRL